MQRSKVIQVYKFIRKEFFPRWDKRNEWTIRVNKNLPATGQCRPERKCIDIRLKPAVEMTLPLFFIHEISHAITRAGHCKKWMNRMTKAAERADRLDRELAQRIREDITSYLPGNCEMLTVRGVCGEIENAVLSTEREISFQKVINWIAHSCGEYPREFKTHYRRSMGHFRKAFDEARSFRLLVDKQRTENFHGSFGSERS